MLLRALAIAFVCSHAATAYAATCNLGQVHAGVDRVPLGCPLIVFESTGHDPSVTALRGTDNVDVTGAIRSSDVDLMYAAQIYDPCEPGIILDSQPATQRFARHDIDLVGAEVGDELRFAGQSFFAGAVVVEAPGPCSPVREPELHCAGTDPLGPASCMSDDDAGGCSTGGGSGLAMIVLVGCAALRRRTSPYVCWR